jgi:signal transduction histidine kinase
VVLALCAGRLDVCAHCPHDGSVSRLSLEARLRWRRLRWFLRWRRTEPNPVPLVLTQTLSAATVMSVGSLAIEWLSPTAVGSQVIAGKVLIVLGFLAASVLAKLQLMRLALWVSVVLTVGAVAFLADGFGPTARGFVQFSALLLMPFLAVIGTLGDSRFAALCGVTVMASTQVVLYRWALPLQDRALGLFIAFLATAIAVGVAVVLGESKRQALHDLRGTQRINRRLAFSEQERSRAERLAVVGRLAASMAHEINNPLAFTLANLRYVADALRSGAVDVDELCGVLRESQDGLHRIESIVERLSVFQAPGRGLAPTDVRQTLAAFARGGQPLSSGVKVMVEKGPPLPPVTLDDPRLARVLKAVVTNAVQALEGAQGTQPKQVRIWTEVTPHEVRIIIDDEGPGIAETVLPHVFEPFITAAGIGRLGLSLALARELLRSIGGDVQAGNRSGGGARVVVILPIAPPAATS